MEQPPKIDKRKKRSKKDKPKPEFKIIVATPEAPIVVSFS